VNQLALLADDATATAAAAAASNSGGGGPVGLLADIFEGALKVRARPHATALGRGRSLPLA
jgi:hypothetical protein